MTNVFPYLLCLLCCIIKQSYSQYAPIKNTNKSPCDDANKTQLVEQFFNVIFTEFQHHPPVCICVQMCANQPTYCYPNGCLNKADNKKSTLNSSPVTNIHHDAATKAMFLVDEKNNFAQMLNARVDENSHVQSSTTASDYFSDPLKDMYKTFFKYKKRPKVELRYNLREQVKNMKSDILKLESDDISKTRWPKYHHRVFHDQKIAKDNVRRNSDTGMATFFLTTPERSHNSYNSKYFKRELRRSDHVDLDSLIDRADTVEKDFSIETLIENLIGNTFDTLNDTKVDIKIDLNVTDLDKNMTNQFINSTKVGHGGSNADKKEEVCVVSLNATNENKDENKYVDESLVEEVFKKWSNYTFDEMISELSKRIDVNNNTSLEMMRQFSGDDHSIKKNKSLINSALEVNVEIVEHKALKLNNNTNNVPHNYSTNAVTTEITSQI